MPDVNQRKKASGHKAREETPVGEKKQGLRDAPSDHTRGERKKKSLEDAPRPVEQGGE